MERSSHTTRAERGGGGGGEQGLLLTHSLWHSRAWHLSSYSCYIALRAIFLLRYQIPAGCIHSRGLLGNLLRSVTKSIPA